MFDNDEIFMRVSEYCDDFDFWIYYIFQFDKVFLGRNLFFVEIISWVNMIYYTKMRVKLMFDNDEIFMRVSECCDDYDFWIYYYCKMILTSCFGREFDFWLDIQ